MCLSCKPGRFLGGGALKCRRAAAVINPNTTHIFGMTKESNVNADNAKAQMRKGILEYCILAILSRNSCYATDIISELRKAEVIVVEGTLYPLLTRQKNAGFMEKLATLPWDGT